MHFSGRGISNPNNRGRPLHGGHPGGFPPGGMRYNGGYPPQRFYDDDYNSGYPGSKKYDCYYEDDYNSYPPMQRR